MLPFPFMSVATLDALGIPADDPRRRAITVLNPVSDAEPLLHTTLLPGLLATLRRNVGRGRPDVALFETGLVYLPTAQPPTAPEPGVDGPPDAATRAALDAALPRQPRHLGVVLSGTRTSRRPAGRPGPPTGPMRSRRPSWPRPSTGSP